MHVSSRDSILAFAERPACPWCQATGGLAVGRVAYSFEYARGFLAPDELTDYLNAQPQLVRCRRCRSLWVSPAPIASTLAVLYARARETYFSPLRLGATEARQVAGLLPWLGVASGRDVLDLGAGCGYHARICRSLGARVAAVEPSTWSREALARDGIEVAPSLEAAPSDWAGRFHSVLVIDVLEHLLDPSTLVSHAKRLLAPGGRVFAVSGCADAPLALLGGTAWWYVRLPGHVSVASREGLRILAERSGLRVGGIRRIPHPPRVVPPPTIAWLAIRDFARSFLGLPIRVIRGRQSWPITLPGGADHVICEFFAA